MQNDYWVAHPEQKRAMDLWQGNVACTEVINSLETWSESFSPLGALWGAAFFLEHHGAGLPQHAHLMDVTRDDARFWADCATPHELEAYIVAGIDRVKTTPFGSRQMKRLAGTVWRRMSPKERAEFLDWVQGAGQNAE